MIVSGARVVVPNWKGGVLEKLVEHWARFSQVHVEQQGAVTVLRIIFRNW